MNNQYSDLLKPITVGRTTFRNRIFTAPIGLHSVQGTEPYPTEAVMTHYANKAKGGAGCVTCGGVSIFPKVGEDDGHGTWDVYKHSNLNYLAQLSERIHFYGAKASMELGVAGVVGGEYGVSDGVILMAGNPAKEMPESEMERIAEGYANTAAALKEVGFDMVLLHFGHGLLVGQFLSPATNKRTDQYGGSAENRARFPMMIIDRIREKVGKDLLIEVRISGCEYQEGGIEIEDAIKFTKMIEDKIDIIHVSAGVHNPEYMTVVHPCGFRPHMPNIPLAEKMKASGVKIPVNTVGGIQNLEDANKVIAEGKTDIIAMARGIIAETNIGELAYQGRGEDVKPCVKCMRCHDSAVYGHHFSCTVNAEIGLEHKLPQIAKTSADKKTIAIIGGGPAGIQAALKCAEIGHSVTLYESNSYLGGALKFSEFVNFKKDLCKYKNWIGEQALKSSVDVKLNTKATPEDIKAAGYDIVIAAVGAEPIVPPIPGIDTENVVMALDSYGIEDKLGNNIAIVGGGQVGCETALHLGRMGRKITLIEMREALAPDASQTHRDEIIWELNHCENITIITSAMCKSINTNSVVYADAKYNEHTIECDKIIVAAGMKSLTASAEVFRETPKERFYLIGDCSKVATVEQAVKSAYYTAVNI
ncbi:MAG: FAD-dependent oxidoreductase [Spirochaetales bacterium]|nr:FAD-dependent oxidoreductase [Spirochaetales bacterium]